jgi:hypothetical protein
MLSTAASTKHNAFGLYPPKDTAQNWWHTIFGSKTTSELSAGAAAVYYCAAHGDLLGLRRAAQRTDRSR